MTDPIAHIYLQRQPQTLIVIFGGTWKMSHTLPDIEPVLANLKDTTIKHLLLQTDTSLDWDSALLATLLHIISEANTHNISVNTTELPQGVQKLMHMAHSTVQENVIRTVEKESFLTSVGAAVLRIPQAFSNATNFIGDVALSFGRFLRGKADTRPRDIMAAIQECGIEALGIVSITSFLFGLILAFVGAVQLTQFGAQIYVAGLVGIGMVRIMGAVMVGVVMSGRMGAAYAALIGTMQVNEEVDALTTFGISPIDFLVLPRMLALLLMTPLLTLYADMMGILGGFTVGVFMLKLSPQEYIHATMNMVPFIHVLIGLVYGTVFGIIIAITGCYQGIRCGRSAEAVGQCTTAAVVNAIVGIIIATAVITVICNILHI